MNRSIESLSLSEKADLTKMIAQKKRGEIDDDWQDICDWFNLDVNADTLRKAGVGVKLAADANMLSSEARADISNGYCERQKLRDLTRQANAMFRAESRSELLKETIAEAVKALPAITVRRSGVLTKHGKQSLVLCLGDFHYGADIHVKGLLGETVNEYNSTVFEQRMEKLLREVEAIIAKESIDEVHMFLVGDLIDGMIHIGQVMRLEYGIIESTMKLAEYLAAWIGELGQTVDVKVHSCTGNHSEVRPLRSKAREFEDENLEKIIMWYLAARFEGNGYVMIDSDCNKYSYAVVENYSFLLLHGDGEKSIDIIAKEAINMYGKPIDYFVCGHTHKEQEYPAGLTNDGQSVIVRTPSICGVDRYAQSKGYGGRPGAIAMIIEEGYGRRCVYPIQL